LGHKNIWKRRSPSTSNHVYRRLFNSACTRELECFLAQVNSHCTISSLRRILRPSDHALLGGVVLPSYIRLGNEAIHELTVGNARDTVLYYLADPSRGGGKDGQGVVPEPTMGRDLEALLCLLLGLKSLDQINFMLERVNFIDEVSRTINDKPCSLWNASSRSRSKRKKPISPPPGGSKTSHEDTDMGVDMALKVQAWLGSGATIEHSQTSGIPFFSPPRAAIKWGSSSKLIPSSSGSCAGERPQASSPPRQNPGPPASSQPLPDAPTRPMFQFYCPLAPVPELRQWGSSQLTGHVSLNQPHLASSNSHGLKYTPEMAPCPGQPEPRSHVTDLLLHTLELPAKQSKIDAQKKQLDECKNVLMQLMHLCEELSNDPLVLPRDVVQDFLRDIFCGLVRDGVFSEEVCSEDSKDLQRPAAPRIPGPIRRKPMTGSQAATARRATRIKVINDPLGSESGAGPARLAKLNQNQLAIPEPGPSSVFTQPPSMPQVSLKICQILSCPRRFLKLHHAPKKTRMEPYPRRKPRSSHPAAREILIMGLRNRIRDIQKKIDKGQGDLVGQQNLKAIMQQQIQHLQETELRDLGLGEVGNAARQRLKEELQKKIRRKTHQVQQGKSLGVNAPMLDGFKELLHQLTTVQAGERDRQEVGAGEENLPSWKGKGKEVENSSSEAQSLFGNQQMAGPGVLISARGGMDDAGEVVNVVGDRSKEHTRDQIILNTGRGLRAGRVRGAGIFRGQAHTPVIVLDDDSTCGEYQQVGMGGNSAVMGNFGDGNGTGTTHSRDAGLDQEMTDAVAAGWKYNHLPQKAPLDYQFGALGAPAGVDSAENHIPAATFGTPGLLGFGTLHSAGSPIGNTGSESLFAPSDPNSAAFASVGVSLFRGGTAFGAGGGKGTEDSPILIEDSD